MHPLSNGPESLGGAAADNALNEEYLLKWNVHREEVLQEFYKNSLEGNFTDVTVATETASFSAHRMVLAACSPYFKLLFPKTQCKNPVIVLKDVYGEDFVYILRYMYLGEVSVPQARLQRVLQTATSLQIKGLSTAVSEGSIEEQLSLLAKGRKEAQSKSPANDEPALVIDEEKSGDQNKNTGINHSRPKSENGGFVHSGRKSANPKKIQLSGDSGVGSSGSPMTTHSDPPASMGRLSPAANSATHSDPGAHEEDLMDLSTNNQRNNATSHSLMSLLGSKERRPSGDENASLAKRNRSLLEETPIEQPVGAPKIEQRSNGHLERYVKAMSDAAAFNEEQLVKEKNNSLAPAFHGMLGIDLGERLRFLLAQNQPTQLSQWMQQPEEKQRSSPKTNSSTGSNGKQMVECEICHKQLADPSSLYRHRKIHSGEKPHACPFCDKRFIQRYNMTEHIKRRHKNRMPPNVASAAATAPPTPL